MRRTLKLGGRQYEIMLAAEVQPKDQIKVFADTTAASNFLRSFVNDSTNVTAMRSALSDAGTAKDPAHINNFQLVDELSKKLTAKTLKISEKPQGQVMVALPKIKKAPPPMPIIQMKKPPPPPPPKPLPKIKLVDFIEVVDKGKGPKVVSRSKNEGVYRQYINVGKDIEGTGKKRRPDHDRYIEVRAQVKWVDKKTKDSIAGRKVHFSCDVVKGDHRPDPLKTTEKEGFSSEGGAATLAVTVDDKGFTPVTKFYLSQYGGDKFTVKAQADEEGKGASGATKEVKTYQVWKKFWYQVTRDKNISVKAPAKAIKAYKKTFTELIAAGEVKYQKKGTGGVAHPTVTYYPEWMVRSGGGTKDVAIIGGHNRADFYGLLKAEAAKPIKAHLIICAGQWDPAGGVANLVHTMKKDLSDWIKVDLGSWNAGLLRPGLNGNLLVSGTWKCLAPNGRPDHGKTGNLTDDDILLQKGRPGINYLAVYVQHAFDATDLSTHGLEITLELRYGKYYAGESNGYQILIVAGDSEDSYNNTISHEAGHAFNQVPKPGTQPGSLGNHPKQYTEADGHGGLGSHCSTDKQEVVDTAFPAKRWADGTCIMFHQQTTVCKNEFCDTCDPYLKLQNMKALKQPT